jgi:hypothetical protein
VACMEALPTACRPVSAGGLLRDLTRMRPLLPVQEREPERALFLAPLRAQDRRKLRSLGRGPLRAKEWELVREKEREPVRTEDSRQVRVLLRLKEPEPERRPFRNRERALKLSLKQSEDRLMLPVLEPDLLNARHWALLRGKGLPL